MKCKGNLEAHSPGTIRTDSSCASRNAPSYDACRETERGAAAGAAAGTGVAAGGAAASVAAGAGPPAAALLSCANDAAAGDNAALPRAVRCCFSLYLSCCSSLRAFCPR